MSELLNNTPVPKYFQLANLFRQRIDHGEWPENHQLPTLDVLAKKFSVARATVRQAIDFLAREGLLSPQQGRGTFVIGLPKKERVVNVVTTLAELVSNYKDEQITIITKEQGSASPRLEDTEGQPATSYVYLKRIHHREERPFCVVNLYLDEHIFNKNPDEFLTKPAIPILNSLADMPIKKAHQVLTIGTADIEIAQTLDIPVGSPIAEVRRVFKDKEGVVIYLANVICRGDAVRIEMDLIP